METHPWLEQVKTLRWNEFYVVTGTGGVRTEMITLWLSCFHPAFHDCYEWRVNPRTGSSNVNWPFVYNTGPEKIKAALDPHESELYLCHDESINKNVICKSHQSPGVLYDVTPALLHKFLRVVAIDTKNLSDAELKKLQWEYVSKTWLDNSKPIKSLVDQYFRDYHTKTQEEFDVLIKKSLQLVIQKQFKIQSLENFVHRGEESLTEDQKSKIIFLDYREIIKPSGGDYVCEMLGLEKDQYAIEIWKRILPMTHTPDTIRFRSTEWSLERILDS